MAIGERTPAGSDCDATRDDVVQAIEDAVTERGWRIRDGDGPWFVVLLPPLARSTPGRDRWPDEPREGPEDGGR